MDSKLEKYLIDLKDLQTLLNSLVETLEKEIDMDKKPHIDQANREKFRKYLFDKGLKVKVVNDYFKYIERAKVVFLDTEKFNFECEIYDISDYDLFDKIYENIFNSDDFIYLNQRHHYVYSASLNNYKNYLLSIEK